MRFWLVSRPYAPSLIQLLPVQRVHCLSQRTLMADDRFYRGSAYIVYDTLGHSLEIGHGSLLVSLCSNRNSVFHNLCS